MHSKTLLLTALGVMFCSGCTTEQQTPAAEEPTVDTTSVKAQLEELGARIEINEQGEIDAVFLEGLQDLTTDAGLVHLSGLTSLQGLHLANTQVTDAGLVHLAGLTSRAILGLSNTQVTDAGVAKLREALPNWKISR